MIIATLFWILLAVSTLYALLHGGAPERIGATMLAGAALLTPWVLSARPRLWVSFEWGAITVDAILLAAFIVLALRAERFWPIWVAGLLLAGLLGSLALATAPQIDSLTNARASVCGSWIIQSLLIVVTRGHRRRLRQRGFDPNWTVRSHG